MIGPMLRFLWLSALLGVTQGFVPSQSSFRRHAANGKESSVQTLSAVLDDDDTSTLDALLRFGPPPAIVRIVTPKKYWEAVDKFQKEEGCSRVVAVRNMDAYFNDPNGWLVARDRQKKYGEIKDYTQKSSIQKRPVFSTFWALFVFWFFLSFLPTRIGELGGFKPSMMSGGYCEPDISVIRNGKREFDCTKNIPLDQLDKIYEQRYTEKMERREAAKLKGFATEAPTLKNSL